MKIKIDIVKLAKVIEDALDTTGIGVWLSCGETTALIGEYRGRQIHLTVTKMEHSFIDDGPDKCVEVIPGPSAKPKGKKGKLKVLR